MQTTIKFVVNHPDTEGWLLYHEDRLVRRYRHLETGKLKFIKKRRPGGKNKICLLTEAEINIYVEKGSIECIKVMMSHRCLLLSEARSQLNLVRGEIEQIRPRYDRSMGENNAREGVRCTDFTSAHRVRLRCRKPPGSVSRG
jgi:hypothetical protein